jgi:hypothetical protein
VRSTDCRALHSEHLPEEFLGQADIVAAQPLPPLQEPARSSVLHLVERLAGGRLLRLREQGKIE